MLFNSVEFLFFFLPLTLVGFFLTGRLGREVAILWLVAASLFFYGWWNPVYLWLILASMLGNYLIGARIGQAMADSHRRQGRFWLVLGVALNLGLLGWFKYAHFAVVTVNQVAGADFTLPAIVLPLAISFFTFQQIAYLVDAWRGIRPEARLSHYLLFVTFFPQLIAGPIVHHKEMLPQFMADGALQPRWQDLAIGLTIFTVGLFKKAVLADGIAPYATPVFDAAARGETLTLLQAWGGALAYTFQLYFDFSGYSDMAIGAARLFGIRLPLNFHSPYKATSIVEFWRRWHMTLSRFLRDYLYIPLGGNRQGPVARYRNLLLTMLLGGLWHGAGWTFVIWGALHGCYLIVNHAWDRLLTWLTPTGAAPLRLPRVFGWALTFLAVVVGWVFFRAADVTAALAMLGAMAGLNGVALPNALLVRLVEAGLPLTDWGVSAYLGGGSAFVATWVWVLGLSALALLAPNTQQWMAAAEPALRPYAGGDSHELRLLPAAGARWHWRLAQRWALATGFLLALGLLSLTSVSEFLYFQF